MSAELVPIVERLSTAGISPELIAEATGVPLREVRVTLKRTADKTPEDEELERQVSALVSDAIRFTRRTFQRGTQTDKMTLTKIILGRMLAKHAGGDADAREEMMVTWQEIREEQRAVRLLPDNVRAFPNQLDEDGWDDE